MSRRRRVLVLSVATVLVALAWSQYWVWTGRVATVDAGRLYRSAALPEHRLLAVCRRHGIATVVDLRTESADTRAEAAALARAGIAHVGLPTGQVPRADTVSRFLQVMDARRREAVLIHCSHGVGRTGVFSAVYRMEYQGWPSWRAIAEAMVLAGFGSFGPGSEKTAFLRAYVPRAAAGPR